MHLEEYKWRRDSVSHNQYLTIEWLRACSYDLLLHLRSSHSPRLRDWSESSQAVAKSEFWRQTTRHLEQIAWSGTIQPPSIHSVMIVVIIFLPHFIAMQWPFTIEQKWIGTYFERDSWVEHRNLFLKDLLERLFGFATSQSIYRLRWDSVLIDRRV